MKVRIITVGKRQPAALRTIEEKYEKRMRPWLALEWQYVAPAAMTDAAVAVRKEGDRILGLISPDAFVLLLDERGTQFGSVEFAKQLDSWFIQSKTVTIIIGGAYGVSNAVRTRADAMWSLSELVFPHELVRMLLTEQLDRAYTIRAGIPYHHA
jgi:23S rRNA (pseudouridine1915-N3)-methyltransferase